MPNQSPIPRTQGLPERDGSRLQTAKGRKKQILSGEGTDRGRFSAATDMRKTMQGVCVQVSPGRYDPEEAGLATPWPVGFPPSGSELPIIPVGQK